MSAESPVADPEAILARARRLLQEGLRADAYAAYLELLRHDPSHPAALHELGHLAYRDNRRAAALTIYRQIVEMWPQDAAGRINLGNMLYEDGAFAEAERHFEAAVALDPNSAEAHRGLGRILYDRGDAEAADQCWRQSFPGQAIAIEANRGGRVPGSILVLYSAEGGNIPTRDILEDGLFTVTTLYAEYYKPDLPLPPHALLFNAIGDADLCPEALAMAERVTARTRAPVINLPARVSQTGRANNAKRLAAIAGVRTPYTQVVSRYKLAEAATMEFPLLLRALGFHTGQHFVRVERAEELAGAALALPGDSLLLIEYLDARGPDGMARKYRVMYIDGVIYPLHLAISADWKVHYITAGMADDAGWRAEEQRFLEDMPAILGANAMTALTRIGETLDLDYMGIDFALNKDKSILLFETNATMVIIPPSPEPMWDYRRAAVARALCAAQDMLRSRLPGPEVHKPL